MEERDLELENIVGNLLIAEYQVQKLRTRLAERVGGFGSVGSKRSSARVFKYNDKWYKVLIRVDELSVQKKDNENLLQE
jgi:hypothetical protein